MADLVIITFDWSNSSVPDAASEKLSSMNFKLLTK
jgi:hypothetical protein